MAKPRVKLPSGETAIWASRTPFRTWPVIAGSAGILTVLAAASAFFVLSAPVTGDAMDMAIVIGCATLLIFILLHWTTATEAAVSERHVAWNDYSAFFGRPFGGESGLLPLRSIDSVDVEEGGNTVTLHCGGESHRLEEIAVGQVEEMARAMGRPARIWRTCKAPAAARARRWRRQVSAIVAGAVPAVGFLVAYYSLPEATPKFLLALAVIISTVVLSTWLGNVAVATLPHLLAGRFLTGEERRDFVCTLTDLRWDGVIADGPDDQRGPRPSRIRDWALRMAYGEIPECREWKPEIIGPATGGPS